MKLFLIFLFACQSETEKISGEPGSEPGSEPGNEPSAEDTGDCPTDEEFYIEKLEPIVDLQCAACHVTGGIADGTDLVFSPGDTTGNFELLSLLATQRESEAYLLWEKATGQHPQGHGGGIVLQEGSEGADAMAQFIGRVNGLIDDCDDSFDPATNGEIIDCDSVSAGRRVLRRLSHVEYDNSITDLFGIDSIWGHSFAPDNVEHGYNNSAEGLVVSSLLVDQYMNASEEIASEVVHASLDEILPCEFTARNLNCAEDFLMEFGTKVFRRPLNDNEMTTYLTLFEDVYYEDGFNEAMAWTIAGLLQSPHFLYRSELGEGDGSGRFTLSSWEIATELSYLIWQTTPDDDLLTLAANDTLKDPATVMAMTQDMLDDPRAAKTIVAMTEQWFSLDLLPIVAREGDYDALTDDIRELMGKEITKFMFNGFSENLSFAELMNAEHSYMNAELAAYYDVDPGTEAADSDGFSRVDLSGDDRYGGLLTQGSILTVHALPLSSSPIHRGVLVRERLMCEELPEPPANIDNSPPLSDQDLSTRDKYELHSSEPSCASCHVLIDPIGFGFEHYDGIGRWRDMDGSNPVDSTGTVVGFEDGDVNFDGVKELSEVLSDSSQVSQCYVQQWFTYGFGEGDMDDPVISCAVEATTVTHEVNGSKLQTPIIGMTQNDRFFIREGESTELDTLSVPTNYVESNPVDTEDPGGPDASLDIYVHEDSNWGSGYCKSVTVTNISTDAITWEISLEVPGTINSLWNAEQAPGNGDEVIFTGVSWNATISPGQAADFGFCAQI